jgi:hypothetical protein
MAKNQPRQTPKNMGFGAVLLVVIIIVSCEVGFFAFVFGHSIITGTASVIVRMLIVRKK